MLLIFSNCLAKNYTWTGVQSTDWGDDKNWSPYGIPENNDTVTIVTGSNNVYLSAKTEVKRMIVNSGTMNLQGNELIVNSTSNFNAGTVNNGLVTLTSSTHTFSGTTFGAKVYILSPGALFNGSVFNDSLTFIKVSSKNPSTSKGGNTFNGAVMMKDSSIGSIVLSDSLPDIFNSTLTLYNTSTASIYIANKGTGNQFNGTVTFSGPNIYSNYYGTATYSGNIVLNTASGNIFFGYGEGSCIQSVGKKISIGASGFSAGQLYLRNFNSLDSSGKITLALSGSAKVYFETGSKFSDTMVVNAPLLYLNGTKFYNKASFEINGNTAVTSLGGCYFGKEFSFTNNMGVGEVYSMGNSYPDTFAMTSVFINKAYTFSVNKGLFLGKVTIDNNAVGGEGFFIATTGDCIFKDSLYITADQNPGMRFGQSGGTTTIDSTGVLCFKTGCGGNAIISNLTKLGSATQVFNAGSNELTLGPNNVWNGNFSFQGKHIALNGNTFNASTTISVYPTSNCSSNGGNVFNGSTTIQDSSSTSHSMYLATSATDDYNGEVTFIQKGNYSQFYPSYTNNSMVAGNLTIIGISSPIQVGGNGGKLILDGTGNQTLGRGSSSYSPLIKKIQIDKTSGSVTLNTEVIVYDSLILSKGVIHTDTTNILQLNHGGLVSGGSDSAYIQGPMKKVGSSAFTFPLGSSALAHAYHPLTITAPLTSTDEYIANYISSGQTIGTAIDTSIDNLNTCYYWNLFRNAGNSKIKITLSWNYEDTNMCFITNPADVRIVGFNGMFWKNLNNSTYSGNLNKGTVTSLDCSDNTISNFTFAFRKCSAFKGVAKVTNVSCHGNSDGVLAVIPVKGTAPYKYYWSDHLGADFKTPPILSGGLYHVTVIDSLGCIFSDSMSITEPDSMQISFTKINSTCKDSTGEVHVIATGGVGAEKKYKWNGVESESNYLTSLRAGEYSVEVKDSIGCTSMTSVYIDDEDGPVVSIDSLKSSSCFYERDGLAIVSATGGTAPYLYKWVGNLLPNDSIIRDVLGGNYILKVIDSLGCIAFDTITIPRPEKLNLSIETINTACGIDTGKAIATIVGGTLPYEFEWSSGDNNTSYIDGLGAGTYTVLLSDLNGCRASKQFDILNTGSLTVSAQIIQHETCFLDSTGIATVAVSGGSAPFTFSWYPNSCSNDTAYNLVSDRYTITVTDKFGCIQKANLLLETPTKIETLIETIAPTDSGAKDGIEMVTVWGGNAPYTFNWNLGSTSNIIMDWDNTSDTVIVTDNSGCTVKDVSRISTVFSCYTAGNPTSSTCGPFSYSCPTCTTSIIKYLKRDFGARGNGYDDDQCAFEDACAYFNGLPASTEKKLIIEDGVYIVGSQDEGWNGHHDALMYFNEIGNMTVEGELIYQVQWIDETHSIVTGFTVPEIKYKNCMKYGLFDFPTNPDQRYLDCVDRYCGPTGYCRVATPGVMLRINHCFNVEIKNLRLNGNLENAIIGGGWSEVMQIPFDGIFINASRDVTLEKLDVFDFGHDGLVVYYKDCRPPTGGSPFLVPPILNLNMNDCHFTKNGRVAMVWGGGWNLNATNCEFSYTGKGRISIPANAGIDIEYEGSNRLNQNGTFTNCTVKFNMSWGLTGNGGSVPYPPIFGRNMTFAGCTFVGSENGWTAYCKGRDWEFNNCHFFGRLLPVSYAQIGAGQSSNDNVRFTACTFSERYLNTDVSPPIEVSFSPEAPDEVLPGTIVTCAVTGSHQPLIDFSLSCRVEMTGCQVTSFFTNKTIFISTDLMPPNRASWSKFDDVHIDNWGLNGCDCDFDLGSINGTRLITTCDFRAPRFLGYQPSGGCGAASEYTITANLDPADYLNFDYGPATSQFNCWGGGSCHAPLVEKYHDVLDPNHEIKFFPEVGDPCPLIIPFAYPTACISPLRKSAGEKKIIEKENNSFKLYPNPSDEQLHISNLMIGDVLQILNATGSVVYEKKVLNFDFDIDISRFDPGVYLVRSGTHSEKIIKL